MNLTRAGGLAALICAVTYLVGFALLVTLLAPLGYGTNTINTTAVVALIDERPALFIAWNTTIYVVNALAMVVLVVALAARLKSMRPNWAPLVLGSGLIWATLVLGAGMIANVAVEQVLQLYASDPQGAVALWSVLHAVELGLGGGNEIAGGFWLLCASLPGWTDASTHRPIHALGILAGCAGLVTIVPPLGGMAGAVFGLGTIAWFIATGITLLRSTTKG